MIPKIGGPYYMIFDTSTGVPLAGSGSNINPKLYGVGGARAMITNQRKRIARGSKEAPFVAILVEINLKDFLPEK